jgi:cellulose synthase/poly-beta-1,6-N-acetylglucosamine synthase-like glycosyltransferase
LAVLALGARLRARWRAPSAPPGPPPAWPTVLVQLPLYNERYVAERLIDVVARLDYPADRLHIQVLDDSTDDTTAIARARVAYYRARGKSISLLHRSDRAGFKAGALAAGLRAAEGDLVAIFDADFAPPADFLRRTVPMFLKDARLAMVQARWGHLNAEQDLLTRAEALALDAYFSVEQVARSRTGLLLSFNGSAGVWRRAAIEAGGGWEGDTLAEDLDLSYRVQLGGWRMDYLLEVAAPAELPTTIMAFKQQQFRWAKGSFQVLRKLTPRLALSRMPLFRKLQGFLHLSGYLPHPLMVLTLLLSLPVVLLLHGQTPLRWSLMGLAGLGPPLIGVFGQVALHRDWPRRLVYYPVLVLLGIGLALNNTHAAVSALLGQGGTFQRTPKGGTDRETYALGLDWTTWGESFLAFYALVTGALALQLAPGLAPFVFLYAAGFAFTAALGFWQSDVAPQAEAGQVEPEM